MMLYGFVINADTKYAAAIPPTDGYGRGAPVIVPILVASALGLEKAAKASSAVEEKIASQPKKLS